MSSTPAAAVASAAKNVPSGQREFGRYVLQYELGAGGMANVYLGCLTGPAGFERLVAIKRIHPHLVEDPRFVEMFLDEARIASRISHPNVCTVHDFGEAAGAYFMALEYLSGVTLQRVIRDAATTPGTIGTVPFQGLAAYVAHEAAEGLHAAHETRDGDGTPLEVVHRDVSPHNIFLTFGGGVKIVDFGIAQARRRIRATATGALKGKLAYMAPEHASGGTVDRRADVWGLGVVLWEMLTGTRLFKKTNEMATILAVRSMPIPRVSAIAPSVPAELDRIVARALCRDPDDRYPTARELARDLAGFLQTGTAPFGSIELSEWLEDRFGTVRRADETRMHATVTAASEVDRLAPRAEVTVSGGPSLHEADTALLGKTTTELTADTTPLVRSGRRSPRLGAVLIGLGLVAAASGLALGIHSGGPAAAPPSTPRAVAPAVATPRPEPPAPAVAPDEPPAPAVAPDEPAAPSLAPDEPPAASVEEAAQPAPTTETNEVTPSVEERAPAPRRRARAAPRRRAAPPEPPGRLNLVTVGGWANVYLGGRRIGQTPLGGVSLPSGRHRLRLVPSGDRPPRTVVVDIGPDAVTRVQVELD